VVRILANVHCWDFIRNLGYNFLNVGFRVVRILANVCR
jgi:hypothetical protein